MPMSSLAASTEIGTTNSTTLVLYDAACRALAEAHRVDEVKRIRDKAVALQAYAKQAKDTDLIAKATDIRMRAERRAGELLIEMAERKERHSGRGDQKTGSQAATPKLKDLDINKTQSSRWQALAALDHDQFEARVEGASKQAYDRMTHQFLKEAESERTPDIEEPASMLATDGPAQVLTLKTYQGEEVLYKQPQAKSTFNRTNEHISWAKWSWNPVTGCLHGCRYCYAREIALRDRKTYPAGFTPLFHPERLDAPKNTEVPENDAREDARWRRVFVCSMADLYGKWVPDEWIEQVHASCIANPQWTYLMLTKFPRRYVGLDLPKTSWLGTSVDEQKRVRLAEEAFGQIKNDVSVKWLSLEPLLEPLKFTDLSMFDWIVIGAQSATKQPDGYVKEKAPEFGWVSQLVDQAHECGCAVYCKPNLLGIPKPQSPGMVLPQEAPTPRYKTEPKTPRLALRSNGVDDDGKAVP
jgi:protein gp37